MAHVGSWRGTRDEIDRLTSDAFVLPVLRGIECWCIYVDDSCISLISLSLCASSVPVYQSEGVGGTSEEEMSMAAMRLASSEVPLCCTGRPCSASSASMAGSLQVGHRWRDQGIVR